MMKNKSLIFSIITLITIAFTSMFFNSCEKNEAELSKSETIETEGITIKNGALSFETVDQFFKTSESLGQMTRQERDNWEASLGFTSMRKELNNIFDEIATYEDESEINKIVMENNDLVMIQDGEVITIIESQAYASITNRDGIFYVEGVIHKVAGSKIASSEDGSEETVSNALSGDLKSSQKGVNVVEYISNSSSKSGCGTRMSSYKEHGKRKLDFEMKTYKYYCSGCCGNYYYQVKAESKITNYRKYRKRGNWHKYNSN